jgi:hypothetical protein
LLTIMPDSALLTILSGAYLYGRTFSGFGAEWVKTPFGAALTIGAVVSLLAFAQGLFFMRPATLGVGKLSASLASTPEGAERESISDEIAKLKAPSRTHARWIAFWLSIAVLTTAVGRSL